MKDQAYPIHQSEQPCLDFSRSSCIMKVSRNWIHEDFVDLSHVSDREFADIMNSIGLKIRSFEQISCDDTVFEFEVHRSDCYSVMGLAREVAAAFNQPLKHHDPVVKGCDAYSIYEFLDADVLSVDQCNRYTTRMVANVKVAPSPEWLRRRLSMSGIQPVNNIVDITNYVMLEYGQPVHAYDYRYLSSGEIAVREAFSGETLTTVDGNLRQLMDGMVVIADSDRIMGLAGIIGGENDQIVDDTVTVVFEAANLNGNAIRETSFALGLHTHQSNRFEKNLDPMMTVPAIQRACELVELLGCGEVMDGMLDILNYIPEPKTVAFTPEVINRLLQADMTEAEMVSCLKRLEIPVEGGNILIPSFRPDLNSIADIATEVKRMFCSKGNDAAT